MHSHYCQALLSPTAAEERRYINVIIIYMSHQVIFLSPRAMPDTPVINIHNECPS